MNTPSAREPPALGAPARLVEIVRRLIWLYFILWIIEGALRKWIVPQFSNPLLLVRDPVVVLIYLLSWRAGIFPRNWFIRSLLGIAVLSQIAGMIVLQPFLPPMKLLFVTLYGARSNFLHLPLIFVIGRVFDTAEVKRIGWWILVGMIPMTVLTALQFRASPEAFINRTVGLGEAQQITAGGGKIRPPGTFSFVSGVIFYLSAATAFVLHGALSRTTYKNSLLFAAGLAVVIGVAVSGSRSAVASVGLVVLSLFAILLIRPSAINRFGRSLLFAVILFWGLSYVPIFQEGVEILSARFTESAAAEEKTVAAGMFARIFSGFTEGLSVLDRLPLGGYGLGIGTNGGAKFLTGRATFLLAEGEWSRVLLESGPILGLMFLLWRTTLTLYLGYLSVRSLARGETLAILLFSAGFFVIANGPFGQPTSLGFAVVFGGLCLAATRSRGNAKEISPRPAEPSPGTHGGQRVRGRSVYADRLHGPGATQAKSNGSRDRRSSS
ncbi:MAG: hypothetical protein H0U99_10835 [Chthoniobacterales bacterium]|nr:hypothetical protein [Chthoniobacterales bacterium]